MTVTVSVSARSVVVVTEGRRNTTVMVFQYPVKIALALQPPRGSKQKRGYFLLPESAQEDQTSCRMQLQGRWRGEKGSRKSQVPLPSFRPHSSPSNLSPQKADVPLEWTEPGALPSFHDTLGLFRVPRKA